MIRIRTWIQLHNPEHLAVVTYTLPDGKEVRYGRAIGETKASAIAEAVLRFREKRGIR